MRPYKSFIATFSAFIAVPGSLAQSPEALKLFIPTYAVSAALSPTPRGAQRCIFDMLYSPAPTGRYTFAQIYAAAFTADHSTPESNRSSGPANCPTPTGRTVGQPAPGGWSVSWSALRTSRMPVSQSTCDGGCFYVGTDEALEVVSNTTLESVRSVEVPVVALEGIKSVAVRPDEAIIAVALNRSHDGTIQLPLTNGSVQFIDPAAGTIEGHIDFPEQAFPASMTFAADGKTLYVLDRANFTATPEPARLYIVDPASRTISKTIELPEAGSGVDLALTPDDAVLFISAVTKDSRGANHTTLFPLDTRTQTFNGKVQLPGVSPGPIVMNPAGTRIYAPERSRNIMVVDTATYVSAITGVTVAASDPYSAAMSLDGRFLVIAPQGGQTVTIVDTQRAEIAGTSETQGFIAGPIAVLP